jgi:hemoglobin
MPEQIKNRWDISLLVKAFYAKVREDEMLGPIFAQHLSKEQWPEHLEKLTDFWESNLFGVAKFRGNPVEKHLKVDKTANYTIEQVHFGRWLQLWLETIDSLYIGDLADLAKLKARKMATRQYLAIWHNRPAE